MQCTLSLSMEGQAYLSVVMCLIVFTLYYIWPHCSDANHWKLFMNNLVDLDVRGRLSTSVLIQLESVLCT